MSSPPDLPHDAVLREECVEALNIDPDGRYVDLTFGAGGHSKAILEKLSLSGKLLALDRDASVEQYVKGLDDQRLIFRQSAFAELSMVLAELGWESVDGILMDLGVSSMQLDNRERGFSFQRDGALDMRMDGESQTLQTASEWLNAVEESELAEVLKVLGEERAHRRIARTIVESRQSAPITHTLQLAEIVAKVMPSKMKLGKNPATRTFQAIRLKINDELGQLDEVLPQCESALRVGGRLAAITFHSLEDRAVKDYFYRSKRAEEAQRSLLPRGLPVVSSSRNAIPQVVMQPLGKAILPSKTETARNRRSRSAKLRVAEKRVEG